MALWRRQKLTIVSLIVYLPTFFVLAHIPVPQLVRQAHVSDKSLHFVAYLILVFLLWFALHPDRQVNWRKAAVWWVFLAIASYGAADELLQGCVTGRSCDAMDYVANLTGTVTGLVLFSFFSFWSALLIVAGIIIFTLTNITRANVAELLPIASAIFYLSAYGFFTALWIRYIHLFLTMKVPEHKWLLTALALPMALLITVKLFSILLVRNFAIQNVIISAAGTVAVVMVTYLVALLRDKQK